jgi:hypothetical protein
MSYRDNVVSLSEAAATRAALIFDRFVPADGVIEDLSPEDRKRLTAALTTVVLVANTRARALAARSVASTLTARYRRPVAPVLPPLDPDAERRRLTVAVFTLLDRAEEMGDPDAQS